MTTRLSGVITVDGGKATSNAVVEVSNSDGDILDQTQVDAEGRYAYHLPAGRWCLRIWDARGRRGEASVTLLEDTAKNLNVDISVPEGARQK